MLHTARTVKFKENIEKGGVMYTVCVLLLSDGDVHGTVPRIIQDKSTERLTVNEGGDLTLECAVEGSPVPQVNWEKYGGQLPVGRYSIVLGLYVFWSCCRVVLFSRGAIKKFSA